MNDFDDLAERVERFAVARDWGQFHTPRNLALALTGEVGELAAELQWKSATEIAAGIDGDLRARLADEVADVLIYLIRFSQVCGIDPTAEAHAKVTRNEARYPVELSKNNTAKYTELEHP
ncbi:nucleotide pyrophosphohydrolase [Pseudonocardia alni]|uniref:nucleotide pyrophosphohydrolase n=1 Tax=Pseudonocardia alni TaxID=33907 RepID=UPI001AD744BE|nr:nucleotide pyrophosphohydrolase [Pseudonocardia alni]MBO4239801.1 nucleotide pyrophosphohydrolase [Pseudonocardia alni]